MNKHQEEYASYLEMGLLEPWQEVLFLWIKCLFDTREELYTDPDLPEVRLKALTRALEFRLDTGTPEFSWEAEVVLLMAFRGIYENIYEEEDLIPILDRQRELELEVKKGSSSFLRMAARVEALAISET